MGTAIVIGADRGIGAALVELYHARGRPRPLLKSYLHPPKHRRRPHTIWPDRAPVALDRPL